MVKDNYYEMKIINLNSFVSKKYKIKPNFASCLIDLNKFVYGLTLYLWQSYSRESNKTLE